MECPICDKEMILARATNFGSSYYYCRSCKKELAEMSPSSPKVEPKVCKHSFSDSSLDCTKCGKNGYSMSSGTVVRFTNSPAPGTCNHDNVYYVYHGATSPLLSRVCAHCGAPLP